MRVQAIGKRPGGGYGRLRGLPERGQTTEQSLLQHAPPGVFHHSDAPPGRRAAGRGSANRPHAAALAEDFRRHAHAKAGHRRGSCALSGGVFAPSFACGTGAADLLPVDVAVPGNPPPPLAILHGLLVAVGRKPPVSLAVACRRCRPGGVGQMNNCALLIGLFIALCGVGVVLIAAVPQHGARNCWVGRAGLAAADCGERLGLGDRKQCSACGCGRCRPSARCCCEWTVSRPCFCLITVRGVPLRLGFLRGVLASLPGPIQPAHLRVACTWRCMCPSW